MKEEYSRRIADEPKGNGYVSRFFSAVRENKYTIAAYAALCTLIAAGELLGEHHIMSNLPHGSDGAVSREVIDGAVNTVNYLKTLAVGGAVAGGAVAVVKGVKDHQKKSNQK